MNKKSEKSPLIVNEKTPSLNGDPILQQQRNSFKKAGLFSSILNLLNCCVGGGILAYPYGYKTTGLFSGISITVLLGILAGSTLFVICYCAVYSNDNIKSYQDLIRCYLGEKWSKISQFVLTVYLAGACVVFLTIVGDSMVPLMKYWFPGSELLQNRKYLIILFSVLLIYPISFLRSVKYLSWPSGFANLGVAYLGIMIVVSTIVYLAGESPDYMKDSNVIWFNREFYKDLKWLKMPEFFLCIPIIAFSFQCHVIILPIYYELKNPTLPRMLIVITFSFILTIIIYCGIGLFGLFRFGGVVDPDVLLSYPNDSSIAIIGRICIAITSTFSYPMVYFTDRLSAITLFLDYKQCRKKLFKEDRQNSDLKTYPYLVTTTVMFVVILLVAILVPDIVTAFGFVGSLGAVTLDFFFPSLLIYKLIMRLRINNMYKYLLLIIPLFICFVALIMMVGGVSVTIIKILAGE